MPLRMATSDPARHSTQQGRLNLHGPGRTRVRVPPQVGCGLLQHPRRFLGPVLHRHFFAELKNEPFDPERCVVHAPDCTEVARRSRWATVRNSPTAAALEPYEPTGARGTHGAGRRSGVANRDCALFARSLKVGCALPHRHGRTLRRLIHAVVHGPRPAGHLRSQYRRQVPVHNDNGRLHEAATRGGCMHLHEFILRNANSILDRWSADLAVRHPAVQHESARAHAGEILAEIAARLARGHARAEGTIDAAQGAGLSAEMRSTVQAHAVSRAEHGFTFEQLAAEYCALRASVLGGCNESSGSQSVLVGDVMRFEQVIDDALFEAARHYSAHVNGTRSLLLAMLSHDMRSPLATVTIIARTLLAVHARADVDHAAEVLLRSSARMQKLLDERIDLSRMELGLGLGVKPQAVDLSTVCAEELEQITTAHPELALQLEASGDCRGTWDSGRFQQMLNNLVVNAAQYGAPHQAIHVSLRGTASDVRLTVANAGETIERETLAHIFEPMRRGEAGSVRHDSGLGLGLYIASEIAKAHGGAIAAESTDRQTVFTVCLPKFAQAGARPGSLDAAL